MEVKSNNFFFKIYKVLIIFFRIRLNSEAEVIFEELKDKNVTAYCSLIKGMLMVNYFYIL
jgi:hypothetical protein